jgi:hypothetical protein
MACANGAVFHEPRLGIELPALNFDSEFSAQKIPTKSCVDIANLVMSSDEIVWQIINQQFCSFKLKTPKQQNFCRNEHNVTGLCNRYLIIWLALRRHLANAVIL